MEQLVTEIKDSMRSFLIDAEKQSNYAAAARARKQSLILTKLLKQYRKDSVAR